MSEKYNDIEDTLIDTIAINTVDTVLLDNNILYKIEVENETHNETHNEKNNESDSTTPLSHSISTQFTDYSDLSDVSPNDNNCVTYNTYVNTHLLHLDIDVIKESESIKNLPKRIKDDLHKIELTATEYRTIIDSKIKENDTIYTEKLTLIEKNLQIDNELILITNRVIPIKDTFNTIRRDEKIMRMNRDIKKNTTRIKDIENTTTENKKILNLHTDLLQNVKRDISVLKEIDDNVVYYIDKFKYYKIGYNICRNIEYFSRNKILFMYLSIGILTSSIFIGNTAYRILKYRELYK